jgi:DNA invertase Pin-like site-specific DNA recombinase
MKVSYRRVSSVDQNLGRQLDGLTFDKDFTDKLSGKDMNRPGLEALIDFVREGDSVFVQSLDRLARNQADFQSILTQLKFKKVSLHLVSENLVITGDDSPMDVLMMNMIAAFAQFERALIKDRQRQGIELAKTEGKYKGRSKSLSEAQVLSIKESVQNGISKSTIAKDLGISRETLYRYLRDDLSE